MSQEETWIPEHSKSFPKWQPIDKPWEVKLRGKDKKAKSAKESKAAPLKPEAKAKSKTDNVDPSIVESCKMLLNELNIGAGDISFASSPHKIIRRREKSQSI